MSGKPQTVKAKAKVAASRVQTKSPSKPIKPVVPCTISAIPPAKITLTNPEAKTCRLIDFTYNCEHKTPKRKCNQSLELSIVPASGDTLMLQPKVENGSAGCVVYELYRPDSSLHKRFTSSQVTIPRWSVLDHVSSPLEALLNPLFWRREPQVWRLKVSGKNGYSEALIKSYPSDKLGVALGLTEATERLQKLLGPVMHQIGEWSGKKVNLLEPTEIRLRGGFYLVVEPPKVTIGAEAEWIELDSDRMDWWETYCRWLVKLAADPLLKIAIKADLGEIAFNAAFPGLGEVWYELRKWLEVPPPFFAELSGSVKGDVGYKKENPEHGSGYGALKGEIEVALGVELEFKIVSAKGLGKTSVSVEIELTAGGEEEAMLEGKAKWAGVVAEVEFQFHTGEWLVFHDIDYKKQFKFFDEAELPLFKTPLLPEHH